MMFSENSGAAEISHDTDSFLMVLLEEGLIPDAIPLVELKASLRAYKNAIENLKTFKIEQTKYDFTTLMEPVDEIADEFDTIQVKNVLKEVLATIVQSRSLCWQYLSGSFKNFMGEVQQAKLSLTVRILDLIETYHGENLSWENLFSGYFENWLVEHRKIVFRYRSYHTLISHLKKDPTYLDQSKPHPHWDLYVAIHEQKYNILRGTGKYDDIPDSYYPVPFHDPLKPTLSETTQQSLCKKLPDVLERLNRNNDNQIVKTRNFFKVFSHSILTSYISSKIVAGVELEKEQTVDFSAFNAAMGITVTDNAVVMFSRSIPGCTESTLAMSDELVVRSVDSMKKIANEAYLHTQKTFRNISAGDLKTGLASLVPIAATKTQVVTTSAKTARYSSSSGSSHSRKVKTAGTVKSDSMTDNVDNEQTLHYQSVVKDTQAFNTGYTSDGDDEVADQLSIVRKASSASVHTQVLNTATPHPINQQSVSPQPISGGIFLNFYANII